MVQGASQDDFGQNASIAGGLWEWVDDLLDLAPDLLEDDLLLPPWTCRSLLAEIHHTDMYIADHRVSGNHFLLQV